MRLDSIKIKLLLAEMEITQSELAKRCGISRQNISTMLLRGTCYAANAGRLAKALGVSVREIIKEE